jgi:hypothetical protein
MLSNKYQPMKRNSSLIFSLTFFMFFLMLLLPSSVVYAQTISPQKLPFSAICAGGIHPTKPNEVFNEYQAQFKIADFDPSVTFFVELSDPTGSFATPTPTITLAPLPGSPSDTETNKTLTFGIPANLVGSNSYRLRVKSSTGIESVPFTIFGSISEKFFPAYYKSYKESYFIANKTSDISFCSGGSVTLTIDNPTPDDPSSSPANFPQLKYNWYKDGNLISGQSSSSLIVNTSGVYYCEINYGPCTDVNNRSQDVNVSSSSGGSGANITSSLGNPFCSGIENTTLTITAANTYIWKLNGAVISGANNQSYNTNIPGVYSCDVDFGGCKATGTIDLKTNGSITANGDVVPEGETLLIEQGNSLTVTANTNAVNPSYQWYLNNNPITSATQSTLDITVSGNYKVIISGCTMSFKVSYSSVIDYNVPKIPNIISPNNDGNNDTWIIPDDFSNTNTKVIILSSLGEIVFETDNYDNYNGWPQSAIEFKNFNPVFYYIITPNVGSDKKGSITLLK